MSDSRGDVKQLSTMRAGQSGRCVQPDNAVGR